MSSWHSYGKIWNLGHAALGPDFFGKNLVVEEKIDGSQFSFGLIGGQLKCRSKGQELVLDAPEKMFAPAVDLVKSLADKLTPDWTYRGEFLGKPKHNVLAYDRAPRQGVIIFDIAVGEEAYLDPLAKGMEAARLGLEHVPVLHLGPVESAVQLKAKLETVSVLGGQKIEGVVCKAYGHYGRDGKTLMGKYVSEAFKEIHSGEWRKENPTKSDVLDELIACYKTPTRWNKAIQRLAEAGRLENDPRDIGALIKSVGPDVLEECGDEIKAKLFDWAWPKIQRGLIAGLPDWYKEQLLDKGFGP